MNQIPRTIHYCWFGEAPLPDTVVRCIDSWKKYCPDFEIRRWDESNFDINCNQYVKEAFETKKWAFVTDYVRLYVLYHYGGVYMDTDVEVTQSLDRFLNSEAFTGCENEKNCVTGLIAAKNHHPWIGKLLEYYEDRAFILPDGKLDTTTNTRIITQLTIQEYGWLPIDNYQILKEGLQIYPSDFFCAKDWETGKINITNNTYAIHHFNGSWHTEKEKEYHKKRMKYKKIFGNRLGGLFITLEILIDMHGVFGIFKKGCNKIYKSITK